MKNHLERCGTVDFRNALKEIFTQSGEEPVNDFELYQYTDSILAPNAAEIPPLFRYTPADYYNIRALEQGKIYLAPIGSMNDVFEGLSCYTDDKTLQLIGNMGNAVYLKSFTENNNSLSMWGQYADSYKGFCVEYDVSKMKLNYYYHLFPVIYSDSRATKANIRYMIEDFGRLKIDEQNGDGIQDDTSFLKDTMALFLNKSLEWQNEKEWRMIATHLQLNYEAEEADDLECENLYKLWSQYLDFDYAKAIYLGARMESIKETHLMEIAKRKKLKVYKSKLSKASYSIEYAEI